MGSFHQRFVLPLAIVTSAAIMFLTWHQHTLKIESPIVPTKAAATAWVTREATEQHCLRASIDIQYGSEGLAQVTGTDGPWFATLRCNQSPKIYVRLALLAFLPWMVLTILARHWFAATESGT